jgi:hypothetical protein
MRKFGLVFILAGIALLVVLFGATVILSKSPEPTANPVNREAPDTPGQVTKNNIEDTTHTVN